MSSNYKKDCYNINEHLKLHYSYGIRGVTSNLKYLHYDDELIIEYYKKGGSSLHIEGNIYNIEEGDVVVLKPDELHVTIRNDEQYMEKMVLHVKESFLSRFFEEQTVFFDKIALRPKGKGNLILSNVVKKVGINKMFLKCLEYAKDNSIEKKVLLSCKVVEIISLIADMVEKDDKTIIDTATSNNKVNQMIDYINRHYTEDITLDTLAKRFHFSKYYISHLFKDYVGVSPYDYLIVRRLYNCNNLIRSNYTIKEACFTTGFNNYSNFYRLYKKHFKITPQQFKEQFKLG